MAPKKPSGKRVPTHSELVKGAQTEEPGLLTDLRELKLYDNRIKYLKGLLTLTALQSLDLSGNRIEYIEGITHLKQVTTLRLAHNKIMELSGFGKMSGLQLLDVSNNRISVMEGLQGCTALRELVLNGNKITAIEGLGRCSRLTELALNGNKLTSLRGLKEVATSVDILWLAENQLESLRGVPDCLPKLTELYIADNKLTSLQPLDKCCQNLEVLDVSRNKLASVKRLAAALSPLGELAELKAEGNPICFQPEGQTPYRERVLSLLSQLRYLDEDEVTEPERLWLKRGGNSHFEVEGDTSDFMPTEEEMEEYKRQMGIRSAVPAMGSPNASRPASASSRPGTGHAAASCSGSMKRPGSSGGSRPSTPGSATLPQGIAPVGPLGRPSTPRSGGQPAVSGRMVGTPLMSQRPPSARSSSGAAVMRPEQYEESLVQFTNTMDQFQMQMQDVVTKLRADLSKDLPEATAAVRANGMRGITAALPDLPQLPTFATRSDTDAAMKKEARQAAAETAKKHTAAVAAAPSKAPQRLRNASSSQGAAAAAASKARAAEGGDVGVGPPQRSRVSRVSDSINAMPGKASALLDHFSRLFPGDPNPEEEGKAAEKEGCAAAGAAEVAAAAPPPAAVDRPHSRGGYKATGGFTRFDMDDDGAIGAPAARSPSSSRTRNDLPANEGGTHEQARMQAEPQNTRFTRVDMDDDLDAAGYSTAKGSRGGAMDLQAQMEAIERTAADYAAVASADAGVSEGLYDNSALEMLERSGQNGVGGNGGRACAPEHHRPLASVLGNGDAQPPEDIRFTNIDSSGTGESGGGPPPASYSKFKLPASKSKGAVAAGGGAVVTKPSVGNGARNGGSALGGRLSTEPSSATSTTSIGSKSLGGGASSGSSAAGGLKKQRPISAKGGQGLQKRAPGGLLAKKQ
eukprot:CAMPEP_0117679096 /NCGR_PEP_ID=MMETSP0804-20121206/17641_1 /TAXON_ID=1074897 /ORGANISM="Tetraselmis astigmatica, Strain CCMP880" /LENGTH=914 /DNA_ID=CAMNT_0005488513 /DNA_START=151 /DNA_END=2897 /DNA_ORIENTATION=+